MSIAMKRAGQHRETKKPPPTDLFHHSLGTWRTWRGPAFGSNCSYFLQVGGPGELPSLNIHVLALSAGSRESIYVPEYLRIDFDENILYRKAGTIAFQMQTVGNRPDCKSRISAATTHCKQSFTTQCSTPRIHVSCTRSGS